MALASVGGGRDAIHSTEYRNACLMIAKCLASQIHEAEELAEKGIFDKLEQLPSSHDWADNVYVRVMTSNGQIISSSNYPQEIWGENSSQVEALSSEDTAHSIKTAGLNAADGTFDDGVVSLNNNWNLNEIFCSEIADKPAAAAAFQNKSNQDRSNPIESQTDALGEIWGEVERVVEYRLDQNRREQIDDFFETLPKNDIEDASPPNTAFQLAGVPNEEHHAPASQPSPVVDTFKPNIHDPNYMRIDSAGFQPSAGSLFRDHDTNRANSVARRIYHLGMVFYELFSGGKLPPPRLYEISYSDRAFVSLPKLSLSENEGHEDSLQNTPKRRQGPSGFSRDEDICNKSCNHLKMLGIPHQLYQVSQAIFAFRHL